MAKTREEGCCSRFWRNSQAKILMMMSMNLTYFVVELVVGIMGKSTTLVIHTFYPHVTLLASQGLLFSQVADSFHMLSDVTALIIAFIAVSLSRRPWAKSTFGFARAEVLGAFANGIFLLGLCFSVVLQSIEVQLHDKTLCSRYFTLITLQFTRSFMAQ